MIGLIFKVVSKGGGFHCNVIFLAVCLLYQRKLMLLFPSIESLLQPPDLEFQLVESQGALTDQFVRQSLMLTNKILR